jgi:hypothetical protein
LTKQELSQCYYLNKEIRQLERELKELDGKEYKQINLTGMPHGSGITDDVARIATQRAELHRLISLKLEECMIARARIERYINSVEDSEMRIILRERHIKGVTWLKIAIQLGKQDANYPWRKYEKFLQDVKNVKNGVVI